MKILFWNIGDDPTVTQLTFLTNSINHLDADVVCFAEGTPNESKCDDLVAAMNAIGYNSYYDPTFYNAMIPAGGYGYRKLGLKVFEKATTSLKTGAFTFADQVVYGRVVYYRFTFNNDFYSCFFIHNKSMAGDLISQNAFMTNLRLCVESKLVLHEDDKVFIVGDFNLDPWDPLLHHKDTFKSYFSNKRHTFYSAWGGRKKFFNPFYEYIQQHANTSLLGTFNTKTHNSLIDFALFAGGMTNYTIDILDSINGTNLLIQNNTKLTITHGFDHLPILITLN